MFDMEMFDNLMAPVFDTVAACAGPKGAVYHMHSAATTCEDVEIAVLTCAIICATIVVCLLILGLTVQRCIKTVQKARLDEIDRKNASDKEKREAEYRRQQEKEKYEAAWRCLNDFVKKRNTPGEDLTPEQKAMETASWTYLTHRLNTPSSDPENRS